MPAKTRRRGLAPGIVLIVVAAGLVGYIALQRTKPILTGSGCQAGTGNLAIALDPEQAAIAATIAGVAHHRAMPPRAVMVAYAAAMQESKLHNLDYGDRDSVGVFQQRPSEGWGPARRLRDPVYATTRFFEVLATVPHYRSTPVYRAAQAVQRSADGYAYLQYQPQAAQLAAAFTGHTAHAVWCWSAGSPARADLTGAHRALEHTFGWVGSGRLRSPGDRPAMLLRARRPALGWTVATWLVTHAASYGIRDVRYAGYQWRASAGGQGWTRDTRPPGPGEITAS